MNARLASFVEDFSDVLTEISVDRFHFRLTKNPIEPAACILWCWDGRLPGGFKALGQFSRFEKRVVIEFIAKYVTSTPLRSEIEKRRFARKVDHLQPAFFDRLERCSAATRAQTYRNLFNLDGVIDRNELNRRRRMMARKFHPDVGGSDRYMTVINEAYEYLATQTGTPVSSAARPTR